MPEEGLPGDQNAEHALARSELPLEEAGEAMNEWRKVQPPPRDVVWRMEWGRPGVTTADPEHGVQLRVERPLRRGRWQAKIFVDGELWKSRTGLASADQAKEIAVNLLYVTWVEKGRPRD